MGVEIYGYEGAGYQALVDYNGWRVAIIHSPEGRLENAISKIEKHLETDEVFILLVGEAALYVGEGMKKYKMEPGKIYNVKCGEWHCITMGENSKVAVVENSNTNEGNSVYRYFKEGECPVFP